MAIVPFRLHIIYPESGTPTMSFSFYFNYAIWFNKMIFNFSLLALPILFNTVVSGRKSQGKLSKYFPLSESLFSTQKRKELL
jgi:hypothetical protein